MDNLSTTNTRIPFLPLAMESAVRAAQPLAENLANVAPELERFSRDQVSARCYIAQQSAFDAQTQCELAQQKIESHLQSMGEMFVALNKYLLKNGTYIEALSFANLYHTDEDKHAKAYFCQVQAQKAKEHVLTLIQTLNFGSGRLKSIDHLEPGALFTACTAQLEYLQEQWKSQTANAQSQSLKLQTRSMHLVAANCLVTLAEKALDDVLCFDDIPAGLEDVLVKLETAMTHPFSGAWPQSITVPTKQPAVVSTFEGE